MGGFFTNAKNIANYHGFLPCSGNNWKCSLWNYHSCRTTLPPSIYNTRRKNVQKAHSAYFPAILGIKKELFPNPPGQPLYKQLVVTHWAMPGI